MSERPHVTLFMATSLDGFIADEEGSEEFLSHENWKESEKRIEEYGNFIVGRKTYEAVEGWGESYSSTIVSRETSSPCVSCEAP